MIIGMMRMRGGERVARALIERADVDIIALEPTGSTLREAGIPFIPYDTLVTPDVARRAQFQIVPRADTLMKGIVDPAFRNNYPALSDTAWLQIQEVLAEAVRNDLLAITTMVEALRHAARHWNLALAVLSEDAVRESRVIAETLRRLGIPSLQIQHGVPCGSLITHTGVHTTHVAAFTHAAKDMFCALGANPECVHVTGNPAWDPYFMPCDRVERVQACARMNLDPQRPILTYAFTQSSTWTRLNAAFPNHHVDLSEAVCNAMVAVSSRHPDWQFLLRPRQREDEIRRAQHMANAARERCKTNVQCDIAPVADTLAVTDVMLCTHSNIGIETIARGKPVINVDIEDLGSAVYRQGIGPLFQEDDGVLHAGSESEIESCMEKAIVDEATRASLQGRREDTLKRFNTYTDGKSTQRVVDVILTILNSKSSRPSAVSRYPGVEHALIRVLPTQCDRVCVTGRAHQELALALKRDRPGTTVCVHESNCDAADFPCVIHGDPIPLGDEGADWMRQLRSILAEDGLLIAWFRSGVSEEAQSTFEEGQWVLPIRQYDPPTELGGHSVDSVAALLGRGGFAPESLVPFGWRDSSLADAPTCDGWVVTSRPGIRDRGRLAHDEQRARHRALLRNRAGEDHFAHGRFEEAAQAFEQAASSGGEARYLNNLGVALHALGRLEPAWDAFVCALHEDPEYGEARENLTSLAAELDRSAEAGELLSLFPLDRGRFL
ncbi:MAG: hypothetical protein AMXMBFR84_04290 [Candidatus Hydrogenedentota bacterium]